MISTFWCWWTPTLDALNILRLPSRRIPTPLPWKCFHTLALTLSLQPVVILIHLLPRHFQIGMLPLRHPFFSLIGCHPFSSVHDILFPFPPTTSKVRFPPIYEIFTMYSTDVYEQRQF